MRRIFTGLLCALILLAYVSFAPATERNIAEFDAHGVDSAWKLLGSMVGLVVAWYMDERYTHFETKATLPVQLIKLAVGFAVAAGCMSSLFLKDISYCRFPRIRSYAKAWRKRALKN